MPVLLIQAVNDHVIAVESIDRLAEQYAAGGTDVTYHRDSFNDHFLLHPMSAPMALRRLNDRFDGHPLTNHLDQTTRPTLLDPATYRGMWRLGVIAVKVVTGRPVHPRTGDDIDECAAPQPWLMFQQTRIWLTAATAREC